MITQLAGYTLTRAIPDNMLIGVMTGVYKVYGGVIRNHSGQIVAHLINGFNPLSVVSPVDTILNSVNAVQLYKMGKDVGEIKDSVAAMQVATTQIMGLAKGTMLLSGLTLAVSAAGFVFLNKKLNKIDEKLEALVKEVREVRKFLELNERARLSAALRTLGGISESINDNTRIQLLVNARQTLGEIHEKYRELLINVNSIQEALAVEEYFSVTALGHTMCSAELDMRDQAHKDFSDAQEIWNIAARRVANDMIIKNEPQKYLHNERYLDLVRTDELIDWLDFAHGIERNFEWIDALRKDSAKGSTWGSKPNMQDVAETTLIRKLVARHRIFSGYASQLEYFAANQLRPSQAQKYIEALPEESKIEDCYLLVAEDARS